METSLRMIVDLDLCTRELEGGQRETKREKLPHHDGIRSLYQIIRSKTQENKPPNHDGTGSLHQGVEGRQKEIEREVSFSKHDGTNSFCD